MCLAVPGQVETWLEREGVFARAIVNFSGVRRECPMACVPHADVGDYVVVHAGIAISRLDTREAERLLADLADAELSPNAGIRRPQQSASELPPDGNRNTP